MTNIKFKIRNGTCLRTTQRTCQGHVGDINNNNNKDNNIYIILFNKYKKKIETESIGIIGAIAQLKKEPEFINLKEDEKVSLFNELTTKVFK